MSLPEHDWEALPDGIRSVCKRCKVGKWFCKTTNALRYQHSESAVLYGSAEPKCVVDMADFAESLGLDRSVGERIDEVFEKDE